MKENDLLKKWKAFLTENNLIRPVEKTLLAVSGGMDSVVLTKLFQISELPFGIAHCNFQLRGDASDADAQFVNALALTYDVPFYGAVFDTESYRTENKLSIEEAARNLRYTWLEEIRKEFGYSRIATGHHLNDSIETIILNLVRGTGLKGITGIPVSNQNIIRPLSCFSQKDIATLAEIFNLTWCTDATNFADTFSRNKIRNKVIPELKELNPSLENTFAQNIRHLQDAYSIYTAAIQKQIKKLVIEEKGDRYISVAALQHLPAVSTVLHVFLEPFGFNTDQIISMVHSLGQSGKIFLSKTHRVFIDRKFFILSPLQEVPLPVVIADADTKTIQFADGRLQLEKKALPKNLHFNTSGTVAYFDADKVEFPMVLRRWRKGDYFYPLGLSRKKSDKPGKKKVSDLLTDLKMHMRDKEKVMVLCSGEKIIWVAGIRQDEKTKISANTRQLLKIKMLP